jgi:hypothetical protein
MVDLKHRYGSNLTIYHGHWKKSATHENFFYWLDEGEGRFLDVAGCPRAQLESERVRYLSKEERLDYLVKIDKEGRLVWAKNGARIDTTEKYKDSIHGIVPATDSTPPYTEPDAEAAVSLRKRNSGSDETSDSSTTDHHSDSESARAAKYATPEFDKAKGLKKIKHVSAATILNKLMRSSVKKNTWIFVADTSFRLYVGIKQSGAFQHSSFLHGSRIAAAGLIKIKDGLLDKLSPLSGHYRPNTSHFRAFLNSLKDAGADMSNVSISRSYAILLGLEAYVKTKRRSKKIVRALIHGRDKILTHDQLKQREEKDLERTETAECERRLTEIQRDEDAREENKATIKLLNKLHTRPVTPKHAVNGTAEGASGRYPDQDDSDVPRSSLENEMLAKG